MPSLTGDHVPKKIKRFRLLSIEGPADRGVLHQFHDYAVRVELDPGGAYVAELIDILVTLFDTAFFAIQLGAWGSTPESEAARARIAYFVIEQLAAALTSPGAEIPKALTPTKEDVINLSQIDPAKVAVDAWNDVPEHLPPTKRRVFISCGQQSAEETKLGNDVAHLVRQETGLDAYFAENQQTLEGVTHNIFNALYHASAFIAIMHRRDQVSASPPEFRASVWVEQEVAIAAFLVQSLGLGLPCRVYVQKGIRREGVRGFILLNSIEFESSDQVLDDLHPFLSTLPSVLPK